MCMACEQAEMYFRWQLLEQIAKGEMPEGMSESDLRAMELPLPGEVARFEEPDGTISFRKVDRTSKGTPSTFVCDSPDEDLQTIG
jgi:hypothetical protein